MPPEFNRLHIIRLSRLLNMLYKPPELARELEVSTDSVYRSYLPSGAPYVMQTNGEIFIHGLSFASWVKAVYKKRKFYPMQENEAWCCTCNKPVELIRPRQKKSGRYVILLQSKCPVCHTKINRATSARILQEKGQKVDV